MEDVETRGIALELKYCERCGGLWLRPRGSDLIFCAGCSRVMAGLTPLWPRSAQAHPNLGHRIDDAFWGEGGNA